MRALKRKGGLTQGRGITASVYLLWVCFVITYKHHSSHDSQQADLASSKISTDFHNTDKTLKWLNTHNPIFEGKPRLLSIVSGLSASNSKGVNCEIAEEIGQASRAHESNGWSEFY